MGFQEFSIHLVQANIRKSFSGFLAVLCLLLTSGITLADPARATDPRLDAFLEVFDAPSRANDVRHLHPWRNYLATRFEEGLSEKYRVKHLAFQNEGNCSVVADMDQYGFTQLYTFLEPAFDRGDIKQEFLHSVVLYFSNGYRRCMALVRLNRPDQRVNMIEDQRVGSSHFKDVGRQWLYTDSSNALIQPLRQLVDLAVCNDYGPAIADLNRLFEEGRLLQPNSTLQYFLTERAIHLGLEARSAEDRKTMRMQVPFQFRSGIDVTAYEPNETRIDSLFEDICSRDFF